MRSFRVARIGGIDIYVHWSWLLAVAVITLSLAGFFRAHFPAWGTGTEYAVALISAVLLFVTVLLHELAHSFTARAQGLPVNSITLFIFGGVSNLTAEPATPKMEFLITVAGPLTNLALAGIFYALHRTLTGLPSEVGAVLGYLASINLLLALFNLIPGFPLDGGRIFRSIVWAITHNLRRATRIATGVGQAIGYLFILGGLVEAFALGQFSAGIWLAFIGWFLQNAASATYHQAIVDSVLRGVEVEDVMDPAPVSVPAWTTVDAIVHNHLLGANQRALAVGGPDGELAGLITFSDVRDVPRGDWDNTQARSIMTPADRLLTVAPGEDLRHAMRLLAENNYHQLPVLRNGRLVGILDRGHVLQWIHRRERISNAIGETAAPLDPPQRRVG